MGIQPCVSAIFTKGHKFVTSCLLPGLLSPFKLGSTIKEKNLLLVSKFFPLEGKNEKDRVASPERLPIQFKIFLVMDISTTSNFYPATIV